MGFSSWIKHQLSKFIVYNSPTCPTTSPITLSTTYLLSHLSNSIAKNPPLIPPVLPPILEDLRCLRRKWRCWISQASTYASDGHGSTLHRAASTSLRASDSVQRAWDIGELLTQLTIKARVQAVIELELEVVAGPNAGCVGDVTLVGQSNDEGAGGGPLMLRRDVQYCKKEKNKQRATETHPRTNKLLDTSRSNLST